MKFNKCWVFVQHLRLIKSYTFSFILSFLRISLTMHVEPMYSTVFICEFDHRILTYILFCLCFTNKQTIQPKSVQHINKICTYYTAYIYIGKETTLCCVLSEIRKIIDFISRYYGGKRKHTQTHICMYVICWACAQYMSPQYAFHPSICLFISFSLFIFLFAMYSLYRTKRRAIYS